MSALYGFIETATSIPSLLSAMSKGDAMKWYQPETDCYLKANRVDHGREYQDAIAEVIASRVGELLHILVVQYQLCRIRINDETFLLGTISYNFCHKNESFISFETMVESSDEPIQWAVSAKDNYELVIDLFYKLTGLAARDYLNTMLLFDFLICNEDRHLNNFGVLKDKTDGSYRFPPLFDNGYALGFMQAEHRPVEQYLYSCKAKPFSTSFSKQLHLVNQLPSGIVLPNSIPDTVLDGLPLSAQMLDYCRTILQIRLQQLKEYTVLNPSHLPVLLFGMNGKATPTATRLDKFFADRCFPSTRQNAKELLAIAGLTLYQPKLICRKTHGIVAHDHYWIRYADDPSDLSYASLMQEMSKAVKAVPSATPSQRHIG